MQAPSLSYQAGAPIDTGLAGLAGIAKLQASLPLTADLAELRRQLKEMQFGNKLAWLEAQQKLVEQQHDLPGMVQHRDQAAASIQALKRQREQTQAEFEKTVLTDLAGARQKAAEFEKEEDKAAQRLALLTLKAPIAGTVQRLAAHTVDGVVTPAQAPMVVVPDDAGLVVEARIPNKDVGFIHAGQEAQIKADQDRDVQLHTLRADRGQGAGREPGCGDGQAGPGEVARERSGQWRQRQSRRTIRLSRLCRACGARQHEHADRGRAGWNSVRG